MYSGKKLIIRYHADTGIISSEAWGYTLSQFIDLPDTAKLKIVSKLLAFKDDTDICCLKVISRGFNGIEGCGGKPDNVDRYDLQIDALYMINRLCWPGFIEAYSCVPVLYDNQDKRTINGNIKAIKLVFEDYIKWYNQCKAVNKISTYFPFNAGRYVWYHGKDIHVGGNK